MTQPQRDIDVEQSRTKEIMEQALPADRDTEGRLNYLHGLALRRRKDPDLEARYERERESLAEQLKAEGPRYFLDSDGVKRYAYRVQPESLEVDVDEFVAAHERGEMPEVDLDKVMPRSPNREALRRAIASRSKVHLRPDGRKDGKIPAAIVAKTMRYVPGTAQVRFASEEDERPDH